jgi:integrase
MNALAIAEKPEPAVNIVPLPQRKRAATAAQRFKIKEFDNASGTKSFRVDGYKRDGSRVRENFADEASAQCRQIELETEYLQGHAQTGIQATSLDTDKLRLAEAAFVQLGDDWTRILDAVAHWKQTGKRASVVDSPRIDDAADQFLAWLEASPLRPATKRNWKHRINVFKNSVQNVRVSEVDPEFIDRFLDTRKTSSGGKDTDRRAVSRFFSWCIERPRRWATTNPCREVKVAKTESAPPSVLTVDQCKKLLRAAEAHRNGLLAPYVAACLFGGLRPFEASRLALSQVNLKDREIRLEANQTKTGTPRTIAIDDTLAKWLRAYPGREFYPANWRKEFDAVREAAGIKEWPHDVMRHTAISHHFRLHHSYGKSAEQFGNSEAIIKNHYQGRVNSDDTKKFYAIKPKGKGKK